MKNKFVISYTWDGGDNAYNLLDIKCIEYESLEKLKEDFKTYAIEKYENRYNKDQCLRHKAFQDKYFIIEDSGICHYIFNESTKQNDTIYKEPLILPLEDWFEYWKENGESF